MSGERGVRSGTESDSKTLDQAGSADVCVPAEGDQSVDVSATGSWDDVRRAYRRGVLVDDEWDILFEGTRTARRAQRAAARR